MRTITLHGYLTLPAKRELCPCCYGDRVSSAYLGSYTPEDMHEQGDDFIEDYFHSGYDRTCEECDGRGYIEIVDEEALDPEQKSEYSEYIQAVEEDERIRAAEARMCA